MSDRLKPPAILRLPGRPPEDLDRLLHDYFRSEMPHPWPAWAPPEVRSDPRPAGRRWWPTLHRRLVVAASVALLLVGYLVLARAFPGTPGGSSPQIDPGRLGQDPNRIPKANLHDFLKRHKDLEGGPRRPQPETGPVPGGRARNWEQRLPGDRQGFMHIERLPDGPGPAPRP
jgi:hypothetical protein